MCRLLQCVHKCANVANCANWSVERLIIVWGTRHHCGRLVVAKARVVKIEISVKYFAFEVTKEESATL